MESDGTFTRVIKDLEFRNWGRTVQNQPAVYDTDPNPSPNANPKLTPSNLTLALHLPKQVTFFPHSKVAVCNIVKWSLENGDESHADKYVLGACAQTARILPHLYSHSPIPFACGTIQYARAGCARRPPAEGFLLLWPTKHRTPGPHHKRPRDMSPHRLHDRARLRLPPHVEQSLLDNRTGATKPSHLQPKPKRLPHFNPPIPSPIANRVVLTLTRTM